MEIKTYIKENWLTKKPTHRGLLPTLILMCIFLFTSFVYVNDYFNAADWMSASGHSIFVRHQWWRA